MPGGAVETLSHCAIGWTGGVQDRTQNIDGRAVALAGHGGVSVGKGGAPQEFGGSGSNGRRNLGANRLGQGTVPFALAGRDGADQNGDPAARFDEGGVAGGAKGDGAGCDRSCGHHGITIYPPYE